MCERQAQPISKPENDDATAPTLSTESLPQTETNDQQAEYFAAYRLQLRRMACPGCGDAEPNF